MFLFKKRKKIQPKSYPKDLRSYLKDFFSAMFELRDQRRELPDVTDKDGYIISAIVSEEREDILNEINLLRQLKNLPPVTKEQVVQADLLATGHVDFSSKLLTYTIELVEDGKLHPTSFY